MRILSGALLHSLLAYVACFGGTALLRVSPRLCCDRAHACCGLLQVHASLMRLHFAAFVLLIT